MNTLSVVIPTINRHEFLDQTLTDLLNQKFTGRYEIIVVDQSNEFDQRIFERTKDINEIRYYHITSFKGLPEARNFGSAVARFENILFLDDDIRCNEDLFEEHLLALGRYPAGIIAGGITEKFKRNKDCEIGRFVRWKADTLRGFHQPGSLQVDHAGGGNFSVKKEVFKSIEGFDEQLSKGSALYEETDFCLRARKKGFMTFYHHKAHVFHLAADTGGCRVHDLAKYIFSLSRNRTLIIERHLNGLYKLTAKIYLTRLVMAYLLKYRDSKIWKAYQEGCADGKRLGHQSAIISVYEAP